MLFSLKIADYMGEGDKMHGTICVNLFFMNNLTGTKGTLGTPYKFFTHRRAYMRTYILSHVYNNVRACVLRSPWEKCTYCTC